MYSEKFNNLGLLSRKTILKRVNLQMSFCNFVLKLTCALLEYYPIEIPY
jgi:hypothetical protein